MIKAMDIVISVFTMAGPIGNNINIYTFLTRSEPDQPQTKDHFQSDI